MSLANSLPFAQRYRWRLQRQSNVVPWVSLLFKLMAVSVALLIAGLGLHLSGLSVPELALKAVRATVGSASGLQQTGILATPLILTGLASALALRVGLWNIGADGQLLLGAWAVAGIGIHVPQAPPPLMLLLLFLVGAMWGGMWMLVPALAWIYAGVNEIITTLLLNFVAVLWVNYFATGFWRDRTAAYASVSYRIPYELPKWFGSLHIGIFIAVIAALVLGVVQHYTRWGYEIGIIGGNPQAARFAGIPVKRHILTVLLISGAIAGVAGMVEATGTLHRLQSGLSNQYGYIGIIVAALANGAPLGILLWAGFMAILLNAGTVLQAQGLSVDLILGFMGLIILFSALAESMSHYRLVRPVQQTLEHTTPEREITCKRF